ncbi:hypothetical protein CHCC14527_3268 [Bacillus paralicheniformis]|nr:hypothetical protein CHCC14527_3268 [Bacillus paralicheniformis]
MSVRPVQNRDIRERSFSRADELPDFARDKLAFAKFVVASEVGDFRSFVIFGPEVFRLSVGVVLNHFIGRVQYPLCRPVVLFEQNDACIRIVFFKRQNVGNVRSAPSVDRLVGVPDDADVFEALRHFFDEQILRPVRILILIDMNVLEFPLVVFEHFRHPVKQDDRRHDQIVKIERLVFPQFFLIILVDIADDLFKKTAGCFLVLFRVDQFVFRTADRSEYASGIEFFRIDVSFL